MIQIRKWRMAMCMMWLVFGTGAGASGERVLSWEGDVFPPCTVSIALLRAGLGDSVGLVLAAYLDQKFAKQGEWELMPGEGLTLLSGAQRGAEASEGVSNWHRMKLRSSRWGGFKVVGRVRGFKDSLNWCESIAEVRFRLTPESCIVDPRTRNTKQELVLNGQHYRGVDEYWLPLDPGEDATNGAEAQIPLDAPTLHIELARAKSSAFAAQDTAATVPILVAVSRDGIVKGARLVPRGESRENAGVQEAALEAASRWKFKPASVDGEPVSALYVIWVPVRRR